MNAQERFDALPSHYVNVSVDACVTNMLIGKWAVANHPETVINPNGDGFIITEARIEFDNDTFRYPQGKISVRGENTCWFAQSLFKIDVL